jgi:trk system potassium uptake protein TrkA
MRAIIVGCGRVGAGVAERLARAGHDVTVIDISTEAFSRLESDFPGSAIRGDGTDEAVLRRAGAEGADLFYALTEGDNRNILAAQLAAETLGIPDVVAKINDPVRAEAYSTLGVATICRTRMLVDTLAVHAGLPSEPGSGGISQVTGQHPGGDHPPRAASPAAGTEA